MLPNLSLIDIPEIEPSSAAKDFQIFFEELTELDQLPDVVFQVGTERFAAHKFIIASVSDRLAKEMVALGENNREIEMADVDPVIFKEILLYAYTKTCNFMTLGPCNVRYSPKVKKEDPIKDTNGELEPIDENKSAYEVFQKKKKKSKVSPKETKSSAKNALQALQGAAKELGVLGLVKALESYDMRNSEIILKSNKSRPPNRIGIHFSRKSFPELHDIKIQCEDNVDVPAHKCILAARLDYFKSMFSLGWLETKKGQVLSLPVPSKVVIALLEYLYRDDALQIQNSDDPEFVSNVLVIADQLLIPRLIQICELQLSQLFTLKNVTEVLQFAFDYSAEQLQKTAMQFIIQNLVAILENRTLSLLSEQNQIKLSEYYVDALPVMQKRRITPYASKPSIVDIQNFLKNEEDDNLEELFIEEEYLSNNMKNNNLTSSAKKRSQKRKNSFGEDVSRRRNISSSSLSSQHSDSSSDNEGNKDDCDTSLFQDDFEFEEKTNQRIPINSPEEVTPVNPEEFLNNFFSPQTKVSPEAVNGSTCNGNVFAKKFTKMSQKERKKLLEESKKPETNQRVETEKPKWTGWGHKPITPDPGLESACPTFTDIMKTQSSKLATSPTSTSEATKTSLRSKKTSWKQLSFCEDDEPTKPVNPWTKNSPNLEQTGSTSDRCDDVTGFRNIVNDQTKQKENLHRAKSKSMHALQVEEKAIQELLAFYNASEVFDEHIRVERVNDGPMATPIWEKKKS